MESTSDFYNWLNISVLMNALKAIVFIIVGYFAGRLLSSALVKVSANRLSQHGKQILGRGVFYLVLILMTVSALRQIGVDLNVLLGAAGIFTIAIGFASQTAASNLISGLFLMFERPFSIGDTIKVGETVGEVIAIDLLSVKLRTFDNLAVRLPNETMLKAEVTTLTKYPIRRFDLKIGIAYKEDIDKVKTILKAIANDEPTCLEEPAPLFMVLGFGASSVDLQFSVWTKREHFLTFKNTMYQKVKKAFDAEGIEIPFPHMTIYTGSQTEPLPITITKEAEPNEQIERPLK
jgi:small-conductance mechanosensitive channel